VSRFKWTVEIEVDEIWVADGFDIGAYIKQSEGNGPEVLIDMGEAAKWFTTDEAKVTLVSAPDQKDIRREQGYNSNKGDVK
jgi:hypothetical protein